MSKALEYYYGRMMLNDSEPQQLVETSTSTATKNTELRRLLTFWRRMKKANRLPTVTIKGLTQPQNKRFQAFRHTHCC